MRTQRAKVPKVPLVCSHWAAADEIGAGASAFASGQKFWIRDAEAIFGDFKDIILRGQFGSGGLSRRWPENEGGRGRAVGRHCAELQLRYHYVNRGDKRYGGDNAPN